MLIAWHLIELNNKCWLCINDVAVIIVIFLLVKTKIVVKNSLNHQGIQEPEISTRHTAGVQWTVVVIE